MKKVYSLGFNLVSFRSPMYYCFTPEQGAFLSPSISQAYCFMSLESAQRDMDNLAKYFFAYPVSCTIYQGSMRL